MNPRLVMCLFGAALVGFMAAAAAVSAGWHPLAALPVFSLSGSFALVALSLIPAPRPVAEAAPSPTTVTA